jgi:hypothetical protein
MVRQRLFLVTGLFPHPGPTAVDPSPFLSDVQIPLCLLRTPRLRSRAGAENKPMEAGRCFPSGHLIFRHTT